MAEVSLNGRVVEMEGADGDGYLQGLAAGHGDIRFLAAAFEQLQPQDGVALDVGANIGLTSLLMSQLRPDGRVLAFEPSPSTFEFLERNLKRNGADNVGPQRLALGRDSGVRGWLQDPANSSSAHFSATGEAGLADVSVLTLDEVVQARQLTPSFIKIDVEGFEMDVLAGAEQTLRKHKPVVFIELNSFTLITYGDQSPKALIGYLADRFDRLFWVNGGILKELDHPNAVIELMHVQLTSGCCVHDLLCIPANRDFDRRRMVDAIAPAERADTAAASQPLCEPGVEPQSSQTGGGGLEIARGPEGDGVDGDHPDHVGREGAAPGP